MRKLDLTNPEDIIEFAENYHIYKDAVSLPKHVLLKIENTFLQYEKMMLTTSERRNQTIDIVVDFIKNLGVKIKSK